jgi:hypothetical protein
MKRKFQILALIILLAMLVMPAGSAFAQGSGPEDGEVHFGENIIIASGETFEGDLVIFGGNVTIEEDAELNGSLVIFGGIVDSSGTVNGDVVIIGGQVILNDEAVVSGGVTTVGGQLQQSEGAVIEGEVTNNIQPEIDFPNGQLPSISDHPRPTVNYNFGFSFLGEIFQLFFWATMAAGFAMVLSLFWKPQMERAGDAIVAQPVMVGAVGLLAFVICILLFLTVIPPLVLGAALLFGVVAFGVEVGERFTKAINQTWSPVLTVGFGTFLFVLISGAIGFVPCIGGLAQFLLGLLAIGSVTVTRFGSRAIQSSEMIVSPPAPPASQA